VGRWIGEPWLQQLWPVRVLTPARSYSDRAVCEVAIRVYMSNAYTPHYTHSEACLAWPGLAQVFSVYTRGVPAVRAGGPPRRPMVSGGLFDVEGLALVVVRDGWGLTLNLLRRRAN